jgi:hypothetical protein
VETPNYGESKRLEDQLARSFKLGEDREQIPPERLDELSA